MRSIRAHLESLNNDVRRICEQLLLRALLVVTLACEPPTSNSVSTPRNHNEFGKLTLKLDPYSVGHALDALRPEGLVELGVDADVGRAHRLLRELDHGLDGMGGPLLERAAVDALVKVDGVFAGDDVFER